MTTSDCHDIGQRPVSMFKGLAKGAGKGCSRKEINVQDQGPEGWTMSNPDEVLEASTSSCGGNSSSSLGVSDSSFITCTDGSDVHSFTSMESGRFSSEGKYDKTKTTESHEAGDRSPLANSRRAELDILRDIARDNNSGKENYGEFSDVGDDVENQSKASSRLPSHVTPTRDTSMRVRNLYSVPFSCKALGECQTEERLHKPILKNRKPLSDLNTQDSIKRDPTACDKDLAGGNKYISFCNLPRVGKSNRFTKIRADTPLKVIPMSDAHQD